MMNGYNATGAPRRQASQTFTYNPNLTDLPDTVGMYKY
jgi:hypothetical protein